jgi:hypothetical protein
MAAHCMEIANAVSPASSSETGIDSCIKRLKSAYLIKLRNIRKPLVVLIGIDLKFGLSFSIIHTIYYCICCAS